MADIPQDLERFVRGFALFQQRFLNEPDAAARPAPAGTAAAPREAAARRVPRRPADGKPRHAA